MLCDEITEGEMRTTLGRPKLTTKQLKARAKAFGKPALVVGTAEYYRAYRAQRRLKEEGDKP